MTESTVTSLALIGACAVLAPVLSQVLRRFRVPSVVLEIFLGILIGPFVLGWAQSDGFIDGVAQLGLSFLMFLAGFEIDLRRIQGRPLNRAIAGWGMSLVIGGLYAHLIVAEGLALSNLLVGLALATTALGTLLPILRDADVLDTDFGAFVMGVGTVGEFGPIVAIALLLTSSNPVGTTVLLALFVVIAALAAFLMLRARPPRWLELLQRNLHSSAQLPVRVSMFLIILLVWIAARLGLDVLLGAFAAGMIIRQSSGGEDAEVIRSKLEAIGFGFLVPVFFVASGMAYDIDALFADWRSALLILVYLCGFLLVRGIPVVLYRRFLRRSERAALALFSATQLPLVVVITGIGTETGRMRTLTSAALVGAAMLSVLIFPVGGLTMLRRAGDLPDAAEGPEGLAALPLTELEP